VLQKVHVSDVTGMIPLQCVLKIHMAIGARTSVTETARMFHLLSVIMKIMLVLHANKDQMIHNVSILPTIAKLLKRKVIAKKKN
jgi:hypothetical protein